MTLNNFSRPEEEGYLDYVESLPDCTYCGGSGEIAFDDDFEHECTFCDGFGKIYDDFLEE